MANLFDRSNYPTQEPATLASGDRWVWKRPDFVGSYPTADYSLTYEFQDDAGGGSANAFTIIAILTPDAYIVEVPSRRVLCQHLPLVSFHHQNSRFAKSHG